jgi:hypothetical protein
VSRKPIFTILLQGGLGNQLFGWAAAESLALKNNGTVEFSRRFLQPGQFELSKYTCAPGPSEENSGAFRIRTKVFKEKDFRFDERFNGINSDATLKGYFQSWKYFSEYQDHIRQKFSKISNTSQKYESFLRELRREPYTAIHIRRGDYVNLTNYHGLTSSEYFTKAKDVLAKYRNAEKVVVFSDDIDAAKDVVDWANLYIGKHDLENSVETLDLMSRATNFVGSNSSFSWWGAYLKDNNSGVRIMPRPWFANSDLNDRDLLLPSWLTLGI